MSTGADNLFPDKAPWSSPSEQRFMALEVDMQMQQNVGVHPEDIYQNIGKGDDVLVIRAPLASLGQALNQLASEGRVVDQRLAIFAIAAEIA